MENNQLVGEDTVKIIDELKEFQTFIKEAEEAGRKKAAEEKGEMDLFHFALLLSGISSCRRVPGIEGHPGYDELYHCETEETKKEAREHLRRLYSVTDAESLSETCERMFHSGDEYAQFQSFWDGTPVFDENELDDYGKVAFGSCKAYAEGFRPFVGEKGFHAWDCNEQIGMYRSAAACGIISDEEFTQFAFPMAKRMAAIYDSWEEYAMSCLCGAVYFMFCESGLDDSGLHGFFTINKNILTSLLSEDGAWERSGWLHLEEKNWAMKADEMKPLLTDWEEPEGCLATDRILVDGCKVGYMYREEPSTDMPDSGWRFFAGDESDEYVNNTDYVGVYHLNTLCNYDPDIIPLLHAPYGTAYFRGPDGILREEPLQR